MRRTDGRTDDTTISVEPIFLLKMCSNKTLGFRALYPIILLVHFSENRDRFESCAADKNQYRIDKISLVKVLI
jgi:hypothetical protein